MVIDLDAEAVKERSQEALDRAAHSTWLERLGRAGLTARGLLYLVVAALAVQVAQGHREARADKQGALQTVVRQPLGRLLVLLLAVGFAGYALWRLVEAAVGPPGESDRRKATVKRIGYAARAGLYAFFSASAVKLFLWSNQAAASDNAEGDWTARVLNWPGGTWLVQVTGLVVIGAAVYIGWRGVSGKFRKRLKSLEMGPGMRHVVRVVGTVGMVARMLITFVIGAFLIGAARAHDPGQAVGIDGALKRLADGRFGPLLLVLVAAGLAAYGLYSLAEARYRRVAGH